MPLINVFYALGVILVTLPNVTLAEGFNPLDYFAGTCELILGNGVNGSGTSHHEDWQKDWAKGVALFETDQAKKLLDTQLRHLDQWRGSVIRDTIGSRSTKRREQVAKAISEAERGRAWSDKGTREKMDILKGLYDPNVRTIEVAVQTIGIGAVLSKLNSYSLQAAIQEYGLSEVAKRLKKKDQSQ